MNCPVDRLGCWSETGDFSIITILLPESFCCQVTIGFLLLGRWLTILADGAQRCVYVSPQSSAKYCWARPLSRRKVGDEIGVTSLVLSGMHSQSE